MNDYKYYKDLNVKLITKASSELNIKAHLLLPKFIHTYYDLIVNEIVDENKKYNEYANKFIDNLKEAVKLKPFYDIVGEIYNDIFNFDKGNLGQCMTPPTFSSSILDLTNDVICDYAKISDNEGCGTGGLILPLIEKHKNCKNIDIVLSDIDLEMLQAATIQCFLSVKDFLNCDSVNIMSYHCNTITEYDNDSIVCEINFKN